MYKFAKISDINVDFDNTWIGKYFLTFDIDWAHEDIILDTIDLLEGFDVKATWFITHESNIIDRIRKNPKFELGIHPNFNNLLNGDSQNEKNSIQVIKRLIDFIPEARCVRSHSLAQSERIFDLFAENNLRLICNTFIPGGSNTIIKPWKLWSDLQIIPHVWQDNVSLRMLTKDYLKYPSKSLSVFDFHPIHIFLNTEDLGRYEMTRRIHQNPKELIKHRYEGEGIRTKLLKILRSGSNDLKSIEKKKNI